MNDKRKPKKGLTKAARARLALEAFEAVTCAVGSLVDEATHYGASLAYLMGALLKGERFEGWLGEEGEGPFLRALLEEVGPDSKVWEAIDFMVNDGGKTEDVALPARIKEKLLHGIGPGNLDEEDYPDLPAWHEALGESK
jgi:hypothetical protein